MSKLTEVFGKNFALKSIPKRINGAPVEIKGYIDVGTFKNIVQVVANSCFEGNVYHAENREIARRYCIIKYMTDLDFEEAGVAEIFKTTQSGNWYSQIETEITKLPVWSEVETAIDNQITYLIETRETAFDKLCSDLSEVVGSNSSENLKDIKEVLEKLEKVDKKEFVRAVTEEAIEKQSE